MADRWRERFCSYPGRSHGHGTSADRTWSKASREKSAEPIVATQYTAVRRGESKDTESMKFTKAKSEDRKPEKKRAARKEISTECERVFGSVYWQRMNERMK